jgi:nucleotide-binding universal stress UspA family protein
MFNQILVPLDGSEYGERALAYAREVAQIAGARVSLLSVIVTATSPVMPEVLEPEGERGRRWLAYLDEQAQGLRDEGVESVTTYVRFGEPARMITDLAREEQADLIVMSTEGLGADGRYALGSIALKVLMTAPCPVFMVRINRPVPPTGVAEERWQAEGGRNVG